MARITENIILHIREKLGSDFLIFDSNSYGDIELARKEADKVVGVCYTTFGDYKAISGSVAIESGMVIDFAVPVTKKLFQDYSTRIEKLAQENNAEFKEVEYIDGGVRAVAMNYVLCFDLTRPTSNIVPALNQGRQTLSLQIKVTASSDLAFGNSTKLEIKTGGVWRKIENTIDIAFMGSVESSQRIGLNDFSSSYEGQFDTSQVKVTYFFKSNDVIHSMLEGHRLEGVNAVYSMRHIQNGVTYSFLGQILSYNHISPVGGFQVVEIVFGKATSKRETSSFLLTLSPSANSEISVVRYGFSLSTGDAIYVGDVLSIHANVSSGYTLTSLKANGMSVANGGTYTVTGDTQITSTVTSGAVSTYILTLSEGEGSNLSVTSNGTPLSTGAIIQQGQTLTVRATPKTGFDVSSLLVNGEKKESGESVVVSNNIIVESLANLKEFSLNTSLSIPSSVAKNEVRVLVTRVGDYYGRVLNESLLDSYNAVECKINYGDVLKYTYEIENPKKLQNNAFNLNGEKVLSGVECEVYSDQLIVSIFTLIRYVLTFNQIGCTVSVRRGASEYLSNNSIIYYGDTLEWEVRVASSYTGKYVTINGAYQDSDFEGTISSYRTVEGDIDIDTKIVSKIRYFDQKGAYIAIDEIAYGSVATIRSDPNTPNCTFINWGTSAGGGVKYSPGEAYQGGNLTLYALGKQYAFFHVYIFDSGGKNKANVTLNSNQNEDLTTTRIILKENVQSSFQVFTQVGNIYFAALITKGNYQSGSIDIGLDGIIESLAYNGSAPSEDEHFVYKIGKTYYYP